MKYAYARVSSADQNLNRQIDSFLAFGVDRRHIYCDKKSGKDFERESYMRLAGKLKKSDLLIIKSIDRLGRNYDMIIEEWTRITKTIGADILVLDMPLLDTRERKENLTGKLISDIVLQLLSYVAQKERENINTRQKEGIASAKRRGVRFGRPKALFPPIGFPEVVRAYTNREIPLREALSRSGFQKSAFYQKMQRLLNSNFNPLPPSLPSPPLPPSPALTCPPPLSPLTAPPLPKKLISKSNMQTHPSSNSITSEVSSGNALRDTSVPLSSFPSAQVLLKNNSQPQSIPLVSPNDCNWSSNTILVL